MGSDLPWRQSWDVSVSLFFDLKLSIKQGCNIKLLSNVMDWIIRERRVHGVPWEQWVTTYSSWLLVMTNELMKRTWESLDTSCFRGWKFMIDYDNPCALGWAIGDEALLSCSSFGCAHVLYDFVIRPLYTYDAKTQKVSTIGALTKWYYSATHTHTPLIITLLLLGE